MLTLKDYVNWGLTHCDKTASAEGVPLALENCKIGKRMKELEIYGNAGGVGNATDGGKYKVPVVVSGKNLYDTEKYPLISGRYIHAVSGSCNENPAYAATEVYIPCVELRGKTITINHTGGANTGIVYYNESKIYISGTKNDSNTKITSVVPDTAAYYRFCVKVGYADVAQVEFGNTPTEYEPYAEPTTTNVYLNEPLGSGDVLSFNRKAVITNYNIKEEADCKLPPLNAKTTVIDVNTSVKPANIKGKYIKK